MQKGPVAGGDWLTGQSAGCPLIGGGVRGPVGTDCTDHPGGQAQAKSGSGANRPLGAQFQALEPEAANIGFVFTRRPAPAV